MYCMKHFKRLKNKFVFLEDVMFPIHPSSIPTSTLQSRWGRVGFCWSPSLLSWGEGRVTPWTSHRWATHVWTI